MWHKIFFCSKWMETKLGHFSAQQFPCRRLKPKSYRIRYSGCTQFASETLLNSGWNIYFIYIQFKTGENSNKKSSIFIRVMCIAKWNKSPTETYAFVVLYFIINGRWTDANPARVIYDALHLRWRGME